MADTVYWVTGVVETSPGDSAFTFKYNDSTWKGFVVIKQIGVINSKVDDTYSAVLGSLRYYAFYNGSLHAGIDKQAIINYEYKLEIRHTISLMHRAGNPTLMMSLYGR